MGRPLAAQPGDGVALGPAPRHSPRDRNHLLLAAGYAPGFSEHSLDQQDMAPIRDTLERLLHAQEPYPALVAAAPLRCAGPTRPRLGSSSSNSRPSRVSARIGDSGEQLARRACLDTDSSLVVLVENPPATGPWWAGHQPREAEDDDVSPGGTFMTGSLVVLDRDLHEQFRHRLQVELPPGWFPDGDADRGLGELRVTAADEVVVRVPAEGDRRVELATPPPAH